MINDKEGVPGSRSGKVSQAICASAMLLARVLNGCRSKRSAEIKTVAPVLFDAVGKAYVVQANVVLFLEEQGRKIISTVAASSCIPTISQYSVVARRCALKMYPMG